MLATENSSLLLPTNEVENLKPNRNYSSTEDIYNCHPSSFSKLSLNNA